jgi:hypothetical protein
MGYRIWYDEGIPSGSEWPETVANHLATSAFVLLFVSPNSIDSENVRQEVNFAKNRKIPMLSVYLRETLLSFGMEMRLSLNQSVFRYAYVNEKDFFEKLTDGIPEETIGRKEGIRSILQQLDPLYIVEKKDDQYILIDYVNREFSHANGLRHLTVIVLAFVADGAQRGKWIVHNRYEKQQAKELQRENPDVDRLKTTSLNLFGGHCVPLPWYNSKTAAYVYDRIGALVPKSVMVRNAIRELSEELLWMK